MLRIRLKRTGNKNNPTYRLVVAESSNAVKGSSMEFLGHYLPSRENAVFEFNKERIEYWISNGAAPSDTVARLLTKAGYKGLDKFMERYAKKRKKKEPPPEAPKPQEASKAEAPKVEEAPKAEDAPAEEPKVEDAPVEEQKPAEEEKKQEPEVVDQKVEEPKKDTPPDTAEPSSAEEKKTESDS